LHQIKKAIAKIKSNATELYLAFLLFVGLPYVAQLYLGWKAFIAVSIIAQTTIVILNVRKSN